MLNVAERAKKSKNRYISGFSERSGRRGRRFESCHLDHKNNTPLRVCCFYIQKWKDSKLEKATSEKND